MRRRTALLRTKTRCERAFHRYVGQRPGTRVNAVIASCRHDGAAATESRRTTALRKHVRRHCNR
eukprot:3597270-Prymnesium_polylepis.1